MRRPRSASAPSSINEKNLFLPGGDCTTISGSNASLTSIRGKNTWKVLPFPGSLSTVMAPGGFLQCHTRLDSPKPVPSSGPLVVEKGIKNPTYNFRVIPFPVSLTESLYTALRIGPDEEPMRQNQHYYPNLSAMCRLPLSLHGRHWCTD